MSTGAIIAIAVAGLAVDRRARLHRLQARTGPQGRARRVRRVHGFAMTERDDSADPALGRRRTRSTRASTRSRATSCAAPGTAGPRCCSTTATTPGRRAPTPTGTPRRSKESHNLAITAVQTERRFPALSVQPEGMFGRLRRPAHRLRHPAGVGGLQPRLHRQLPRPPLRLRRAPPADDGAADARPGTRPGRSSAPT